LPSDGANCYCPEDRKSLTPALGRRSQAEKHGRRRITCERGWGREDQCDRDAQDLPTRLRERRAPDDQDQRAGTDPEHDAAERAGSGLLCTEADEGADEKRQCIDGRAVEQPTEETYADEDGKCGHGGWLHFSRQK